MTWLVLRPAAFARVPAATTCRPGPRFYSAATTGAGLSDPLRILFCGSDDFSCAALSALHAEKKRNPALIESLDVVVRPGKLSGRGMKSVREVPLKNLAEQLRLPIYVRDTFTGWQPRNNINLIIAVSFGLFVPPRLLKMAKYGGLNVHPSLLPDFRGPAPLQHTLLKGRTHTGITLQTLDHEKFDHGAILAQSPLPGIPIPEKCSTQQLLDIVTPPAADMLVDGLRRGLYVPPHADAGWKPSIWNFLSTPPHAPKVTNHDRQIPWFEWTADHIVTRQRVLGNIWCSAVNNTLQKEQRIKFGRVEAVDDVHDHIKQFTRRLKLYQKNRMSDDEVLEEDRKVKVVFWIQKPEHDADAEEGKWRVARLPYFDHEDGKSIVIPVFKGDKLLKVSTLIVEGAKERPAASAIKSFGTVTDAQTRHKAALNRDGTAYHGVVAMTDNRATVTRMAQLFLEMWLYELGQRVTAPPSITRWYK
ncbi:formyl transferase [Colletotrichum orchidophilum]|uniref:methionyl-tRNA formyltransferase n=1 Tax=Colletotrichum orchidophilum TaxID=1209926 RepID=A0A1G4AYB9_9PEZI|nr:formyl transferase [Colletotrichum orchidophilum]OHE94137.1 formyl transferase [Colletotrichum orchidophilum]